MSRSAIISALLLLVLTAIGKAAYASSDQTNISLTYEPTSHTLELLVPRELIPSEAEGFLPSWLSPRDIEHSHSDQAVLYTGTVPRLEVGGRYGASERGTFLLGLLRALIQTDTELTLTLESALPFRGVATGDLISESKQSGDAGVYRATFNMDSLDRTDIFFGPYQIGEAVLESGDQQVRVRTYFKEDGAQLSERYLSATQAFLERYIDQIGPYPFDDFSVVSAPIPVGYAFPRLTYISEQILGHPYMLGRSLAHEVVHSWWGSGVEVDYPTGNWAEGLTTYMADYALAADQGPERAKAMRQNWLTGLTQLAPEEDRPLGQFISASHERNQSVGYGKSALLFHALQQRLGDELFDEAIRKFWRDNRGETAGWSELERAFEATSNQDLSRFFDQWLNRTGLPKLTLAEAKGSSSNQVNRLSVRLQQSSPAFELDLPLVAETAEGTQQFTVALTEPDETFDLRVESSVKRISVDPNFEALRALDSTELPSIFQQLNRLTEMNIYLEIDGVDSVVNDYFGRTRTLSTISQSDLPEVTQGVFLAAEPERIAALRAEYFTDPAPLEISPDQLWIEQDEQQRFWVFSTTLDPEALANRLYALRYYGMQSFADYSGGGRPVTGRWPVKNSALTLDLE